jgi:Ser/Thr protein kinase RdoA (MazF antagonist)
MQTKLSGKTFDRIKNPAMAREAGEMYARFHRTMDSLKYRFESPLVLHQTENVLAKFLSTAKKFRKSPLMQDVKTEVEFIEKIFPMYLLPSTLPKRVIHGDPKISNILFASGKGLAIIDLDTCTRASVLVELGDAFRSWCAKEEDDSHNTFSLPLFRAAWIGYARGAKGFLTKKEIALVPKAIGTITLELATRFLIDYFEDSYFGFDPKRYSSRRAHNLARCRGQLAEFADYHRKFHQIKDTCSNKTPVAA